GPAAHPGPDAMDAGRMSGLGAPMGSAGERWDRLCHLTVIGQSKRIDMAVPVELAVAAILPELVRLAGEEEAGGSPGTWVLQRPDRVPLAAERSLEEEGVVNGEHLHLVDAAPQPAPPGLEDPGQAIATVVDACDGRWTRSHLSRL